MLICKCQQKLKGVGTIKKIMYITDLDKLKALSDPLRVGIITSLGTTKKNSQQLAKLLKINRTRIHYHLNILEEMGFVRVVDTDLVNGIVQKYYLPTAHAFVPSPDIFSEIFNEKADSYLIDKAKEQQFLEEFRMLTKKYTTNQNEDCTKYTLLKL